MQIKRPEHQVHPEILDSPVHRQDQLMGRGERALRGSIARRRELYHPLLLKQGGEHGLLIKLHLQLEGDGEVRGHQLE